MIRIVEPRTRCAGQGLDEKKNHIEFPQIMKGRLLGRLSHRREDSIKRVLSNFV
jgi:hypothetical protein